MAQAIVTRYKGPSNVRGSRIIATADAKRKIYHYDYSLGYEANHDLAAKTLAESLGWLDGWELAGGSLPGNGGNVYVLIKRSKG